VVPLEPCIHQYQGSTVFKGRLPKVGPAINEAGFYLHEGKLAEQIVIIKGKMYKDTCLKKKKKVK
jgi:hypothetical protein